MNLQDEIREETEGINQRIAQSEVVEATGKCVQKVVKMNPEVVELLLRAKYHLRHSEKKLTETALIKYLKKVAMQLYGTAEFPPIPPGVNLDEINLDDDE